MRKIARMILFLLIILFFINYIFYQKDPYSQDILNSNLKIFEKGYILGTDDLGRDLLSRIMQGFYTTGFIVLSTLLISFLISIILGSIMGYYSKIDKFLMIIIEIIFSIPSILLILSILIYFSSSIFVIILCLSITRSLRLTIFVRNEIKKLKTQNYVIISETMGANFFHILRWHLIPNFFNVLIVKINLLIPGIVFTESFLSFLGVGVKIPRASLGNLISNGFKILSKNPNQFLISSLILVLITISFDGGIVYDKD